MRVYCDTGGYQNWLKDFENLVEIVHFPYENINNKIKSRIPPTHATWGQMNITWNQANFTWGETEPSEMFDEIKKILHNKNRNIETDTQHLDCAYKSKCQIFITSDKKDILANKVELEKILNLKICNHLDKSQFEKYLNQIKSG